MTIGLEALTCLPRGVPGTPHHLDVVLGILKIRIDLEGCLIFLKRLIGTALHDVDVSEAIMCLVIACVQFYRLAEHFPCVGQALCIKIKNAKIVICLGIIRLQLDGNIE